MEDIKLVFDADTDKVANSVEKAAQISAKNVDKSFGNVIKNIEKRFIDLNKQMEKPIRAKIDYTSTKDVYTIYKDMDKTISKLGNNLDNVISDSTKRALNNLKDFQNIATIGKPSTGELEMMYSGIPRSLDVAKKDYEKFIDDIQHKMLDMPRDSFEFRESQEDLNKFNTVLDSIKEKLNIISDAKPLLTSGKATVEDFYRIREALGDVITDFDKLPPEIQEVTNAVSASESKVQILTDKINELNESIKNLVGNGRRSWENIQSNLQKAQGDLERFQRQLDYTTKRKGTFFNKNDYYKQIKSIMIGLQKAQTDVNKFEQEASDFKSVDRMLTQVEIEKRKLSEEETILEKNKATLEALSKAYKETGDAAEEMGNKVANASNEGKKTSNLMYSQIALFNRAANIVKHFANTALGGVKKSIQLLNNAIKSIVRTTGHIVALGKFTKKSNKASEGSFKSLLKYVMQYGFGVRSLYFLIKRLRKYTLEAFNTMAKYIPEVNKDMSILVAKLNELKGSLGSTFQPFLTQFRPLIEHLINSLIRLMNVLAQINAVLTGQGYWYKASAAVKDYASNLGSANKQLAKFDELNNLTTSGSGSNLLDGVSYEKLPIEDWIAELVSKINRVVDTIIAPFKEAWKTVRDTISSSIMQTLSKIKDLVIDIGKTFLTVWSESNTAKIFENILTTLSYIITTVGNLTERFREAWNEANRGLQILRGIRDLVLIVSDTIANMAIDTSNWSDKLDFGPLLDAFNNLVQSATPAITALSDVMSDFYNTVLLPLGQWVLEKGLPDLLQVFTDFNNTVDWESLRTNLQTFWEHLEPFAEKVGEGLIMFIDDLAQAIAKFVNSETFENILITIEEKMDNMEANNIPETIFSLASALTSLYIALNLIKGIATVSVAIVTIAGAIEKLAAAGSLSGIVTLAKNLSGIGLVLTGLSIIISNFISAWEHGSTVITRVCEAIGIAIVALGAILLGAPALVTGVIAGITAAVLFLVHWLRDRWLEAQEQGISFWQAIKNRLKTEWETLKNKFPNVTKTFSDMGETLKDVFKNVGDFIVKVWQETDRKFKNICNSIRGVVEGLVNGVITGLNYMINALNGIGFDIPDWVPFAGGKGFHINLKPISTISIPRLAQGAVIPPNKEFMAILGDQKNGTNIETPLATMVEAFNLALDARDGNRDILLQEILQAIIDKETGITSSQIFSSVRNSAREFKNSTGRYAF